MNTLATLIDVVKPFLDLSVTEVNPNVELKELGLDSLSAVGFLIAIERHWNVRFPSEMINRETFRSLGSVEQAVNVLVERSCGENQVPKE